MSVKLVYFLSFLDFFKLSLVLPLINPHILSLGGTLTGIGVLTSICSGMQLLFSPVIGSWSDTRGRKSLLLYTLIGVLISDILLGSTSIAIFFFARILDGIVHQTDPLMKALIIDKVPQEAQTDALNKLMIIICISFIIGPILGGYVYELFNSFTVITVLLCTLDIILISISFLFLDDSSTQKSKNKKDEKPEEENENKTFLQSVGADIAKVFANLKNVDWSKYGDSLTLKFYVETAFSFVFMNMGMILRQVFLFNRKQLGLAIAFLSSCMVISTFFVGIINKKLYPNDTTGFKRIFHCLTLMILAFGALPMMMFMDSSILYLLLFIPTSIGKTVLDSTFTEVLVHKTTESDKGVMMGAATSMVSLSRLICPLVSGFIADNISIVGLTVLPIIPSLFAMYSTRKLQNEEIASAKKED